MKKALTFLVFAASLPFVQAQWSKTTFNSTSIQKKSKASYYTLDIDAIRNQLSRTSKLGKGSAITISVPNSEGKLERFAVNSFPVMDEALATRYQLGSYVGVGIDDPSKVIRFSVAPNDFQSMVIGDGKYEFIEPVTSDKSVYSVHAKSDKNGAFACKTTEKMSEKMRLEQMREDAKKTNESKSNNKTYQTLRLALSVTGEYTEYFGGRAGALTQMNATMSRVNGVFEKEFNVHLNIVDAPELIFTDPKTDPYSDAEEMDNWSLQLMNTLHGGKYGVTDASFDIGHLFGASGGGGYSGCIACVCSNNTKTFEENGVTYPKNYKGSGFTSPASGDHPKGDNFDIDFVAHEMGHQMGASHTYSFYEEYLNKEMEPGSGSTIMGYAGITGSSTDVQAHSDAYFHAASIDQIQKHLSGISCSVKTPITNSAPVIKALTGYTIPKGTPFVLTANATDPDGDQLTYAWEEMDACTLEEGVSKSSIGTTDTGASFRSWPPSSSPTRYFPKLSTVLSGSLKNVNDFEAVSTVARTTNFRVTVRDNKVGGQTQTNFANQTIVIGDTNPFAVNPASGSPMVPMSITWNVSGTTTSPYNVSKVKIDFTLDNGDTWTTLSESTNNNGTASVTFPASAANKLA